MLGLLYPIIPNDLMDVFPQFYFQLIATKITHRLIEDVSPYLKNLDVQEFFLTLLEMKKNADGLLINCIKFFENPKEALQINSFWGRYLVEFAVPAALAFKNKGKIWSFFLKLRSNI